ncbi:hypothetical protein OHA98_03135 [Streptomyces sp. NBC_00654]|uniref:hypothetical protein n=1 Tax=Streptomyces sp. NBC_00654 TaxID=2975799 RepID=UPI0022576303|nr:hypothetical protein [Streptomyces sp. NBC_00654]MCX4963826.1 hypothetical protein [Streptomyces sp. NBC_00654]
MSETPQVDPRQGFGESRPTQPLGQGTPAWGPAAQGPGQAPPPMPGQAPPPVPPQAPGGPSAWSQPVPAGGPGSPGPRGGRSRIRLIGGVAALAVAVIVGVVIATSGGDDKGTASGKPSGSPGDAAKPEAPSGKAFTKVPKGCELIKASTIEKIAPGGECTPGLMDDKDLASMITRMPRWEHPGYGGAYQGLDVNLMVGTTAKSTYDINKRTALKDLGGMRKVQESRSVSGLGEEAFVVDTVDTMDGSLAQAEVIVREGNASLTINFTYSRDTSDITQKRAEDAAVTAARDVLGSLS